MEVLHFGRLYDVTLRKENITRPTEMLCFAAKWHGKKKVMYYSLFHDGKEVMLEKLWHLLNECDILITYNGKKFDVPHMNRELLEGGFLPPSPYRNLDLYETVRRVFTFESSSLDFVSKRLEIGAKIEHAGMALWRGCMDGNPECWAKMKSYNMADVRLTEDLYEGIKPWIKVHPSVAFDADGLEIVCPACGSNNLVREGFAYTQVGKFQRYTCGECGKWSRDTRRVNVGGTGITEVAS
jgi:predicted RNA-binding Zn-ribbon protein involved in translation (DUF1610 family)